MQDADDDKPAFAPRGDFGKFLKEIYVTAFSGGAFEKFAEFIDNQQHAVFRPRFSLSGQPIEELAADFDFGARAAVVRAGVATRLFKSDSNVGDRVAAAADHWHDKPAVAARFEGGENLRRDVAAQGRHCRFVNRAFWPKQRGKCHGQAGLSAAVGPGPGEGALRGLRNLRRHIEKAFGRGSLADKSLQGFETPDVAIEAYRALEPASNVDVFDKHYATCCLSPCPL
ncbi:hypothetical protein [Rhodoblastus sp.]|uniref:hypothetical protein n=1 Tax=Rhodoblastus sp. TaxID=1962975 RepID=UPI0025EC0509|nr:hypothetical protein [Rhodoblastus sp.]